MVFSPHFQAFPIQSYIMSNITKERWKKYKKRHVGRGHTPATNLDHEL